MSDNPYAAPASDSEPSAFIDPENEPLAGRFTRLVASIIDGILMIVILVPLQFGTGYFQRAAAQEVGILEQIAMSLSGMAVMLLLNGYLLAKRGQTIGKVLFGIQIVDFSTGQLMPFIRVYGYRYLWMLPLVVIVILIPGTMDDLAINGLVLIDVLLIFGTLRRCLHDYIAGSKVVLYRENREMLA